MKPILTIFVILIIFLSYAETINPIPDSLTILQPYTTFDYPEVNESSAVIKSRLWKNVYWTLNDSGDEARIFPFNKDGKVWRAKWYKEEAGIYIPDAVNADWEDMTTDDSGNIYIAAFGNNDNYRRDLAVYVIKESFPQTTSQTRVFKTINFYYPEQKTFPAQPNNFDSEALFWAKGKLYLLTKHRADTKTCLYRFDSTKPHFDNPLSKIGEFDIEGMVTSAEANDDGTKLAVLTYYSVWLFESNDDNYFSGKKYMLPISAKQCEAVCFETDDILMITNEQAELFLLKTTDLIPVE